jgi:DNA-binding transcriptional LysR family regulator
MVTASAYRRAASRSWVAELVALASSVVAETAFERALRAEPRSALEAGSTSALVGAVLAGVGPAVVSTRAVAPYLDDGRLVAISHELDLWRPISAITEPGQAIQRTCVHPDPDRPASGCP